MRVNQKDRVDHGLTEMFYETGELENKIHYRFGKLHGKWECFYKNGRTNFIAYYKNGEKDDLWEWFDEDGNLEKQVFYYPKK